MGSVLTFDLELPVTRAGICPRTESYNPLHGHLMWGRSQIRKLLPFLLLAMLLGVALPPTVKAAVLTVCPSCQYTKIQDAINAAVAFDTVQIMSTYNSGTAGERFPVTLTVTSDIAIAGQVDSSGVPTTTIDISPGLKTPHDGFIVVTDRVTISNLKIIDSSSLTSDVNRAIAAAAPESSGRVRENGLHVSNVVIDLRGPNGFHGANGVDLIADNAQIEGNTIQGVTDSAISLDGIGTSVRNNRIIGVDSASKVITARGIAFGDDLPGGPCSGSPSDYTISGNSIDGVTQDGIVFCNGIRISITGNSINDAVSSAVNSAGSQHVTVSGSTITWSRVAGQTGIGFSQSSSITIADNQVTGRPAMDVVRGIVLGTCANCQVLRNTVQNFASDAVIFAMPPGAPTASIIDGNSVQNNKGNGLSYLGADQGSTTGDSTIMRNNLVANNQLNGIIFSNVKGPGNAITGNSANSNNLGLFAATHGFNLQALMNTIIDHNQAFNNTGSGGAGAGFFIANSQSLSGGCNIGSGNAGGLFAQVSVSPPFSNAGTVCTPFEPQPVPLSTLSSDLLNAPANSVYFIFPDSNSAHPKPSGVGYAQVTDWTALGFVYGSLTKMPQVIALDTNSAYIDQSTGAPKVSNGTIVLFGGPLVNEAVHYYEVNGIAPLHWGLVGGWTSGTEYYYNQTEQAVASLPISAIVSNQDMGLIEAFMDQNGNTVIIFSGFGWKGTFFSGVYFKTVLISQLSTMPDSWYIYSWTDSNSNGFPEVTEVNPTPVNHGN